jgi:hypothetical protein
MQKTTIDYTSYDIDALKGDIIEYLKQTQTYKDADLTQSNINTLVTIWAWIGSLNGYYINSAANEVFLPTAKRYKNLNKIAQMLRYDARGVTSSAVNVLGALNPSYVFGKSGKYIEIPAYSIFPSTKPTISNINFNFTNTTSHVQLVKAFGVTPININDISYNNYSLPFEAPASFFADSFGNIAINPTGLSLPLSLQRPLSIINLPDSNGYRGFDTANYPLFDPSNPNSVGQPFINTIPTITYNKTMVVNTPYYLVFNWDKNTASPYISIAEDKTTLGEKSNDILVAIILEPTDDTNTNYVLKFYEDGTVNRFFTGVLGLQNLDSTKLEFSYFQDNPNAIRQIHLVVNKDGSQPPLTVLINGSFYTFSSGSISSQQFDKNFFSSDVPSYNVNLVIADEKDSLNNYGARLEVTANPPLSNQVTIATITTNFIDSTTSTSALATSNSTRFGNFQVVEPEPIQTSEQKAGQVTFSSGATSQKVYFNNGFTLSPNEVKVEYSIQLTPSSNVRTWYSNADESGFTIYVEPNTQFEGTVGWSATRIIQQNVKQKDVIFDTPIPLGISQDGLTSNYMVQLTPNDNIQVWYEDAGTTGFSIKTEKSFAGKISWSIFNFFQNDTIPSEPESGYRQIGTIVLRPGETSAAIQLKTPITDTNYAIQLVPNANLVTYYTNKSSSGFTINIEPGVTNQTVTINWYVDSSTGYAFQRHGEIDFSGSTSSAATIPGLRFVNIPETFNINNLLQGQITFTYIDKSTNIDANNNGLNISVDPSRLSDNDVRYIVNNPNISINSIRVFVKNDTGIWDEWKRSGTGFNSNIAVGQQIFYVRANPDQLITIDFGDGVNYGTSPLDKETFILGLVSVGKDGNINKSTLDNKIIVSQYILGNDQTDIKFEDNFVELLGLKTKQYFNGSSPETRLVDSEGTKLQTTDLTIIQNQNAFGGNNVETVDELRKNSTNYFTSQGRNVSINDTLNYVEQVFSDYVVKAKVLDYESANEAGLIPASQNANYFFNHVFVIILNKDGTNTISKNLNDLIVSTLDSEPVKVIGKKHVVIPATWVPIDVLIRYKAKSYGNPDIIESQIKQSIGDYFNYSNHSLGETIENSYIGNLISTIDAVDSFEVMLNKNPGNKLAPTDYVASINTIYSTQEQTDIARRNKLMELVTKDPSLVRIFQPLFSSLNTNGTTSWDYSLKIELGPYEFPQLGNIILELEQ